MIAIKGSITMPESCWNCNFCLNEDGYYCAISGELLADEAVDIPYENRQTDCPLTEIITCQECNNSGICKKHPDIDGAKYCSTLRTYTRYDFYCGDGERRE